MRRPIIRTYGLPPLFGAMRKAGLRGEPNRAWPPAPGTDSNTGSNTGGPNADRRSGRSASDKPRLQRAGSAGKFKIGTGLTLSFLLFVWVSSTQAMAQTDTETRATTTPVAIEKTRSEKTGSEKTGSETTAAIPATQPTPGPGTGRGGRTTTDLLTFIRALEAPRGYTDYERRIPLPPPKPLTAMSLGAVLDWQVRVRQTGAPSTAAGGYQIIYPTLARLMRVHGLDRKRLFDAATQDHLARLLIAECGRKGAPRTHALYGNCLAGIWAALPLTHGPRKGRSAHHGVAGNRALTTAQTVLALLAGQPVALPSQTSAWARTGPSASADRLAFDAARRPVETRQGGLPALEEINDALRAAKGTGRLTRSVRTWKRDPYAQE